MSYDYHDWRWDEREMEDYEQEKEDHAWAVDFSQWLSFSFTHWAKDDAVRAEAADLMDSALEEIFDHQAERFRTLLFKACCSNDYTADLRGLLSEALLLAYRKNHAIA